MPRRSAPRSPAHDHDAGGDPELLEAKAALRERIWAELDRPGIFLDPALIDVDASGARLGKGGGFSDLEIAAAAEAGLVDERTIVVTTVHEHQLLPDGAVPTTAHDLHVDVVVTPDRVLRCPRTGGWVAPAIRWGELTAEKIAAIPLLQRLRGNGTPSPPAV